VLFNRLDFQPQLFQVSFQSLDLFRLGLEAALEMTTPAAITTAITSTTTGAILLTITGFLFTFAFFFV
jgi:hypothetical protein